MSTDTRPADLPHRIVVDQHGHYWRDWGDHLSMPPVSDENVETEVVAVYALSSNPAPVVGALRRLVETWEAAAEDTIGENVLALGPLMVEGRQVLDVAARHATPELDVLSDAKAIAVVAQELTEPDRDADAAPFPADVDEARGVIQRLRSRGIVLAALSAQREPASEDARHATPELDVDAMYAAANRLRLAIYDKSVEPSHSGAEVNEMIFKAIGEGWRIGYEDGKRVASRITSNAEGAGDERGY